MTLLQNRPLRREIGVLLMAPKKTPAKDTIKAAFSAVGLDGAFSSTVEHSPGDFEIRTKLKTINVLHVDHITSRLNAVEVCVGIYRGHVFLAMKL